jgi:hypothetical protein
LGRGTVSALTTACTTASGEMAFLAERSATRATAASALTRPLRRRRPRRARPRRIRIRDVEDHRREPARGLADEHRAVTRSPHPRPDSEPDPVQVKRAGGADAGRGAGDEDGAASPIRGHRAIPPSVGR